MIKGKTRLPGFAGDQERKKHCTSSKCYAQVNKGKPATFLIAGEARAGEDKQMSEEFKLSNPDVRIEVTGFVARYDLPVHYLFVEGFQTKLGRGICQTIVNGFGPQAELDGGLALYHK
ncbi:MAG: hypothetical protein EHM40_01035 [Chloroflexi bacterium]|nr:MAG: hypothetical protein EHM40_01035 [Chloroflexota bacterium]